MFERLWNKYLAVLAKEASFIYPFFVIITSVTLNEDRLQMTLKKNFNRVKSRSGTMWVNTVKAFLWL